MGYDMSCMSGIDCDESYFRANIWGMQTLRTAMKAVNILDFNCDHPKFPVRPRDGNDFSSYDKELIKVRSFTSKIKGLIPVQKFCSNDGWIVTPEECNIIFEALSRILDKNDILCSKIMEEYNNYDFVKMFADYCKHAVECGGFEVW